MWFCGKKAAPTNSPKNIRNPAKKRSREGKGRPTSPPRFPLLAARFSFLLDLGTLERSVSSPSSSHDERSAWHAHFERPREYLSCYSDKWFRYSLSFIKATVSSKMRAKCPPVHLQQEKWSNYIRNLIILICYVDGDFCKRSIETAGLQVYGSGFYYNGGTSISISWVATGTIMILWIVSTLYWTQWFNK